MSDDEDYEDHEATVDDDSEVKLACPSCGDADHLGTLEEIMGTAGATFYADGEVDHDGETEVHWDTSTTVGVQCTSCGWEALDKDQPDGRTASDLLVPEPQDCDNCGERVAANDDDDLVHTATGSVRCYPDDKIAAEVERLKGYTAAVD